MEQISNLQLRLLAEMSTGETYSSRTLANLLGVSDRTIRNAITALNPLLEKHGAVIAAKTRTGCVLRVSDERRFRAFCDSLDIYGGNAGIIDMETQYANAVIRYLLCSKVKMIPEELADLLYTNVTTIKNALRNVRTILREFDLKLVSGQEGISIEGSEHDKRTLLVYEHDVFTVSGSVDKEKEPYAVMYEFDPGILQRLRTEAVMVQNDFDNYDLSAYGIDYICRMLLVSRVRDEMGYELSYPVQTILTLSAFRSFLTASQLVKSAEKVLECRFGEETLILITMCYAGLRVLSESSANIAKNFLACRRFATELVGHISDLNRFELLRNDNILINSIAFYLMSYMMRADFHIVTNQFIYDRHRDYPPMAKKMALQAFLYLYREYQLPYRREEIQRLTMLIYPALGRHREEIVKINAAVVSDVDISIGRGMAERLERNFGNIISRIDVLHSYRLRETDLSEYDVLFTSYEFRDLDFGEQKKMPNLYYLEPFFHNYEKNKIYAFLTTINQQKSNDNQPFAYLKSENLNYDVRAANEQEALRYLCEYMENSIDNAEALQAELEIAEYIFPSPGDHNVAVLSGLTSHAEEVMISVMVLKKGVLWGDRTKKVQILVYWDQGKKKTESSLFEFGYLPNFLQTVFKSQEVIDALLDHESCERINMLINKYQTELIGFGR